MSYRQNGDFAIGFPAILSGEGLGPATDAPLVGKKSKEVAAEDGDLGREIITADMGEG